MPRRSESAREVWRITEWRDGAVYRTKKIDGAILWVPTGCSAAEEDRLVKEQFGPDAIAASISNYDFEKHHRYVNVD